MDVHRLDCDYTCGMKSFAKKPATYEDLLAVPETMIAQIVDGELVAAPRPANEHALACSVLAADLSGPFQRGKGRPGGWWILYEPEIHLARDVLVPDIAGWRTSRLPIIPREPFFTLAPDWVCEVLSPSTAGFDRVRKLEIFRRERVGHVWFADPTGKTLEVLRNEGGKWVVAATFEGNDLARAEPFDAIELELAALWVPLPPSP